MSKTYTKNKTESKVIKINIDPAKKLWASTGDLHRDLRNLTSFVSCKKNISKKKLVEM